MRRPIVTKQSAAKQHALLLQAEARDLQSGTVPFLQKAALLVKATLAKKISAAISFSGLEHIGF